MPRKNLPQVVTLLTEVLQSPSFPADEFDTIKRAYIDQRKQALDDPGALAFRALQRTLEPYAKDNIRYIPTYEEEIARLEAMTLDQVKEMYAEQLGGQNAVLVVVGDFDDTTDAAKRPEMELAKLLRNWKAKVKYDRVARPAKLDIEGKREVIQTPDKENAFFIAGEVLALTDSDADYAALEVGNFLFGGGALSSRLGNRVRQKEGLSYGANSVFGADVADKAGRFFMYAICNPENIERVDKAVAEELALILKEGVSAAELDEAKSAFLKQRQVQRTSDGRIAAELAQTLEDDRTFAYHAELEKKIAALTVDQVNTALRKHWQPKKLVIVRAGDFSKKKEK